MTRRLIVLSIILLCILLLSSPVLQTVEAAREKKLRGTIALVAKDGHPKWGTDGRQDSNIVYFEGKTHIAYESSEGLGYEEPYPGPSGAGGYVKVVTFDHSTQEWLGPFRVSDKPVYDEHGYPVLTVDSKGYLHIVYDGHDLPMKYKRSVRPNDASQWTAFEQVGERATYPHLFVGPNDTLFFFYRERGGSYDRFVEDMCTKDAGGHWSSPKTIIDAEWKANDPSSDFVVYTQSVHLGQDSVIYVTWSWYDRGTDSHHDVGFARSPDFGDTWTWSNGTRYSLPIKRTAMYEKIWSGMYPSYQTSVAASRSGEVIVLLFEHAADWSWSKIHLRVWNGKTWKSSIIATDALNAKAMIDYSGIAHGTTMAETPSGVHIKYMEARPPYNAWTLTSVDSGSVSFYPSVMTHSDGNLFQSVWHSRVSLEYSELYMYSLSL